MDAARDRDAEDIFARVEQALEVFDGALADFKKQPIAGIAHKEFVRLNSTIRALPRSLWAASIDKLIASVRRGHLMLRELPPQDLEDILTKLKEKWLQVVEAGAENISLHEMLASVEEAVERQREQLRQAQQTKALSSQSRNKLIKDGLEVLTGAGFITSDLLAASQLPIPATMTSISAGFTMFWRGLRG